MDGIVGEVIYIVIMLVIFIFSALKSKKGKRGDTPVPERDSDNPMDEVFSPFKDIFDDKEETSDREEPERAPRSEPAYATSGRKDLKDAPFVKEDYVFTANTSPGDSRRQRKNKTPGQQKDLQSESDLAYADKTGSELAEWFDLRQAVIYSEILKRPDY
jgi:hypothetical protein